MGKFSFLCFLLFLLSTINTIGDEMSKDNGSIQYYGYDDCVKLENKDTRVIVSGACGGRILEYSLNGVNALYLDPAQDGWTYTPGKKLIDPSGGRLDIGPEYSITPHLDLWLGRWDTERTGQLSARMTSVADKAIGVQLVRDFVLSENSSTLKVTQTIKNISSKPVRWFHWSRTFAIPGGICIIPIMPDSRFPGKYAMYEPDFRINIKPQDDNVIVEDETIFVTGFPKNAKLGFDSSTGKIVYLSRNNLLFKKEFPVYPDKSYGEPIPISLCVCYQKKFCELEPIGPQETIKPEGSVSFTETWYLTSYPFPEDGKLDLVQLRKLAE